MAYKAAQMSYLVDLGMRPDADESTSEGFVRSLADHEMAEFERIGDQEPDPADINRGDAGGTNAGGNGAGGTNPGNGDNGDDIQRGAGSGTPTNPTNPAGTGANADVSAEVQRALAQDRADRQRRADFIRSEAGDDVPADLVQRALAEDWDETRVSREFLRSVRTRPAAAGGGHVGIHSRSHSGDCTLEALQGGLLLREGFALDDPMFGRMEASAMLRREGVRGAWLNNLVARSAGGRLIAVNVGQADPMDAFERSRDQAHRYSSMSLVDFCREALRLANRTIPDDRDDMIRRALSTATLSAIFSTSVNMQILQAYLGIEDSTRGWTYEADVSDFKQNDRGRLTKASGMKKLARGGEAQQIEYGDAVESYKIARYAGKFEVDEQDMIDDRFGGLSDHTPQELGELAAELRPNLVFAILFANADMRDNKALFHADHGNLLTTSALGVSTLATAKKSMAVQTENGRSIRNAMRYLIVPEALWFAATQLVQSVELRNQSTSSHDGVANPLQNRFSVVSDPRLDNGVQDPDTGQVYSGSATSWYGAAAAGRTGIEVGYRRGTGRAPRMDTYVMTGARWGMGWKCNLDIGAKAIDWRGLLKATA